MNAVQINEKLHEVERQLIRLTNKPVRIVWDHPQGNNQKILLTSQISGLTVTWFAWCDHFIGLSTSSLAALLIHHWLIQEAARVLTLAY